MMVRVGFVLHAMQVAGAEMLVAQIVRRLRGRIEPTILCLDAIGPLGESLQADGIEVVSLHRRPGRDWRAAGRLATIASRRRVQVLHAHQYSPFFYAALAKLLMRRRPRLIFTEHGRHFPDIVGAKRRAFNRLILNHLADHITACCTFSADSLGRLDGFHRGRIEVIENGIDLSRYAAPADRAALCDRLGLDPSRRYVINVARLHPVKDHAMLIEAFAGVAAALPDVDLLLAGGGPLRGDIQARIERLDLARRVKLLGVRDDIPDLLRAADVFALTSLSEAASLTLLEAMAAGRPVVVTNVGGNPEIVRDGVDGLLVPRGDAESCGVALRRVLDDAALAGRLGASGQQRVRGRYQVETTIQRYARLYER